LEQLENFEKKLWLKKKFVVETNYCVTLDRMPEDLYAEIAANNAQREEWVRLFAINEFTRNPLTIKDFPPPAFSVPLTLEFLKANPFLVLDTKFFGREFKNRFLASFENLDEQTDGLLIESENFHALNLIQERYREQIRCIYIDPPYNTGPSEIIYKNTYKHSSWASLISNRVRFARSLKKSKGVMAVAIDDNELVNLWKLLEAEFPDHDVTPVVVVHNPRGNITNNFAKVHEYALFLTEKWSSSILRTIEESGSLRKMRRWGENSRRTDRPTMFYPIYVKDEQITRIGDRPDDSFHPTGKNVKLETGETEIWPIDQDGVERRWNFGLDSIHQNLDRIVVSGTDGLLDLFVSAEKSVPKTVWSGGEFDAGKYGNNLLISIIGQKLFSFPKSINNVAKCLDIVCREAMYGTKVEQLF
jgi:adenine-specific DNA-methyltransferase